MKISALFLPSFRQAKARQCARRQFSGVGHSFHNKLRKLSAELHSPFTIGFGFAARLIIRFDNSPNGLEGFLYGSRYLRVAIVGGGGSDAPASETAM